MNTQFLSLPASLNAYEIRYAAGKIFAKQTGSFVENLFSTLPSHSAVHTAAPVPLFYLVRKNSYSLCARVSSG